MAGYHNYSMSNNAVQAYNSGEKPLSKWTKAAIIEALQEQEAPAAFIQAIKKQPSAALKEELLYRSSWHHTSSRYNKTDFYSVEYVDNDNASDFLQKIEAKAQALKQETKEQPKEQPQRVLVSYVVWEGTRKHPKAREVEAEGTILGNWFTGDDGTRKKVDGNYFKILRRIQE